MNITIVGGGIIGLNCAYYLQQSGHQVTVIDDGDITDGCSFGNMGYISPSHFVPLATPGIVRQGIKWMFDSSSPFYIKPRLNKNLIGWGLAFNKSANTSTLNKNIPPLNNLLQLSRTLINEMKNEIGDNFSLSETGVWMLYKNEKTGDHEKHLAEQANELGIKTIICNNAQQVQEYEPEVEVNVAGGVLYPGDAYVEPRQLMQSLHKYLSGKNVRFILNNEVVGFEKNNQRIVGIITNKQKIETDEIVIACGSWLPEVVKLLGIKILLQPGKGYSFEYDYLKNNLKHASILVNDRVATTPYDRRLRIGGTMELSGHSSTVLPKRVLSIYNAFKKYYPAIKIPEPDTKNCWYGYRPVSPDGVPYIGRHNAYKNLSIAGGHAMLGISASNATGKIISDIINRKKTAFDINAFAPERF